MNKNTHKYITQEQQRLILELQNKKPGVLGRCNNVCRFDRRRPCTVEKKTNKVEGVNNTTLKAK